MPTMEAAVVSRRQKLIAAGMVLAAGIALALPLRRDQPLASGRFDAAAVSAKATPEPPPASAVPLSANRSEAATTTAAGSVDSPPRQASPFEGVPPPKTSDGPAKVFTTISSATETPAPPPGMVEAALPDQEVHIVHEGDSLAGLARRYLGDESRALELFDLNRDVLGNPHVLPLGAELRIPLRDSTDR